MIRNGPLKISKSLKKAENGPFGKNLFPITEFNLLCKMLSCFKPGKVYTATWISNLYDDTNFLSQAILINGIYYYIRQYVNSSLQTLTKMRKIGT